MFYCKGIYMSRRIFTYIVFVPKMFSLQRLNLLLVTLQIGGEKVEFGDGGGGGGCISTFVSD